MGKSRVSQNLKPQATFQPWFRGLKVLKSEIRSLKGVTYPLDTLLEILWEQLT